MGGNKEQNQLWQHRDNITAPQGNNPLEFGDQFWDGRECLITLKSVKAPYLIVTKQYTRRVTRTRSRKEALNKYLTFTLTSSSVPWAPI